jgi:hypothetical protein
VQALGGNPASVCGEMVDWGQRAACEQVAADTGETNNQRQPKHQHHEDLVQLPLDALRLVDLS